MGEHDSEPEDVILERLQEAASGDATVRQLRRRYDLLRQDYERLLDRLGELEERLAEATRAPAAPATPVGAALAEALAAPLMQLRQEYLAAAAGIAQVVSGLEGLAGGLKGQHGSARAAEEPARGEPAPRGSSSACRWTCAGADSANCSISGSG
ncbi:hypothetical protein O0235_00740 [Tepidiforma flava]|uniref:Uncharacterized protein n=1 Tax=Tepidiforma flava TaxID=3004094 RepID=A0ABY7M6Z3_9CHLR|nr:hypothetical protein [Tepidiforma flava]WBL36180.1 hypothetical protein O0235_00740 [Tepidiforma flava]